MLLKLGLKHVGPPDALEMELGERLNLITGDNGLGKTFLLDIAWWALTYTWPDYPARPREGLLKEALIEYEVKSKSKKVSYTSKFDPNKQAWIGKVGRPIMPGMVIYARVDGGYSVWDPARNYWRKVNGVDVHERQPAYFFNHDQVWNGLKKDGVPICKGLIQDWVEWQKEKGDHFDLLQALVAELSPDQDEKLTIGPLKRISIDDVRDYPTLTMPYGDHVPIVQASSAIRRIMGLAYLLVWTWREHLEAAKLRDEPPTERIIFLIDEIDTHLHPRWQRTILKSLMRVADLMTGTSPVNTQMLATTHSPLIIASMETEFDSDQDRLWTFKYANHRVSLEQEKWMRRGDVNSWMTSDAIGLPQARSLEAEVVLEKAKNFMRGEGEQSIQALKAIDLELRAVLGDTDPVWSRWSYFRDQRVGHDQG